MNSRGASGSTSAHDEIESIVPEHVGRGPKFYSVPVPRLSFLRPAVAVQSSLWSLSPAKRMLDIIAAAMALVLLSPALVLVSMLVAFSSEGPVMFTQERVGRLGQLFTIYKFRTMYLATNHKGPIITRCGDRRITGIGKLLRRFKIDELPQFYNVLCGDMSLVGPRPKLAQHEGIHMPFRPGITGAATLAFRSEEEMLRHVPQHDLDFYYAHTIKPLKTRIDCHYMKTATLSSDLKMLVKTAAACMLPRRYHSLLQLNSPDLAAAAFELDRLDLRISDTSSGS